MIDKGDSTNRGPLLIIMSIPSHAELCRTNHLLVISFVWLHAAKHWVTGQ